MSNCVFGWPILSDVSRAYTPTFAAFGSFLSALPKENMQDRRLAKVARSTNAAAGSTRFRLDLGASVSVGLFAILLPNITKSSTPTIQWQGGSSAGLTDVYDSGALQIWPTGLTADDVTTPSGDEMHVWYALTLSTPKTFRYLDVSVVDTANVDGYVDFARLIVAASTTLTVTLSDGARIGDESNTTSEDTDGGATLYNARRGRRTTQFSLDNLTHAESMATVRKMQRRLGTSGQVFWVPDPSDATYGYERNYLGVLRELSPLQGNSTRWNTAFSIREEL